MKIYGDTEDHSQGSDVHFSSDFYSDGTLERRVETSQLRVLKVFLESKTEIFVVELNDLTFCLTILLSADDNTTAIRPPCHCKGAHCHIILSVWFEINDR